MKLFFVFLMISMIGFGNFANAATLRIAAAADLKFALDEVIKAYQIKNPGNKVEAVYGSSGKLVAQILEGAPFDLFLSADNENTERVIQAQKNVGRAFPYAQGHLALWVKKDSKLNLDKDLKCLRSPDVKKIAVANPEHAPYGKIAMMALKNAGLADEVKSKLVQGENIAQTAQFIQSGAADVGLIAMSLAQSSVLKSEGRFVEVDPKIYPALIQAGVVLKGKNDSTALQFEKFFIGAEGQKIMTDFGLTPIH